MSDLNVMYIHGFGSHFDRNAPKIQALQRLGHVYGPDIDYCYSEKDSLDHAVDMVEQHIMFNETDLLVGTSMGGYIAAHVGAKHKIPFIAANPVIHPIRTYHRREVDLPRLAYVWEGRPLRTDGVGIVLLDMGDDILDPWETVEHVRDELPIFTFEGGSHRFDHMNEAIDQVESLARMMTVVYGFADN